MQKRKAFTLIEVLISIFLLGLILVPLFSVVDMMKASNAQLLKSLERTDKITKATKVLFLDIMGSDGNLSIKKDEFTRLCIEETSNSLYNLPIAKVCWLVLKEKNTLVRAEGNAYKLPLGYEDRVEVDKIMSGIELFDVTHYEDKVLVVLKEREKKPISFMLQGITKPKKKPKKDAKNTKDDQYQRDSNGNILRDPGGRPLLKENRKQGNRPKGPGPQQKRRPGPGGNATQKKPGPGDRDQKFPGEP